MAGDGAQRIIQEIEKAAEHSVSEIVAEAARKAEAIVQDAGQKAEEQERALVSRGEQEARRESQRILAEARIKARREKVKAQEEIVQKSFERARDMLQRMAEGTRAEGLDYGNVLERLLRDSIRAAGAEALEVLVNPRDRAQLSPETLSRIGKETGTELGMRITLKLSDEPLTALGGIVVRSTDGKVRVDNTFEARTDRFREEVRTRVAQELFGREPQNG